MMTIYICTYTYISHYWYSFSMLNRGHVMIDKWATNGDSDVSQFRSDSRSARAAKQIRLVDRRGDIILIRPKRNHVTNFQFRNLLKYKRSKLFNSLEMIFLKWRFTFFRTVRINAKPIYSQRLICTTPSSNTSLHLMLEINITSRRSQFIHFDFYKLKSANCTHHQ